MGRVTRAVVDEGLWLEARKKVLDLRAKGKRINTSQLTELGLKVILAVLNAGYIPDDLGYLLEEHDPEALRQLQQLLDKARAEAVEAARG